jgi:predicted transcriptional regulator
MTGVLEKVDQLEQAARLHLKGYSNPEIARELAITLSQAKSYVTEYKAWIANRAQTDPDFLDRLADNTLQALDEINLIYKEAWDAHSTAKEFEMMQHQLGALKLLKDISDSKAKLLQLAGAKADGSSMAQLKRAEQVNEIVSTVLKDVVKECPRCKPEVMSKLAQAFDLMNRGEDIIDMEPVE